MNVVNKLNSAIAYLESTIESSKRARESYIATRNERDKVKKEFDVCVLALSECNKMYSHIGGYINNRRSESLQFLNDMIADTEVYIEESDFRGARLTLEGDSAYLKNAEGANPTGREGGAARTIIDLMLRVGYQQYTNSPFKLLILDEPFSFLSDKSTINIQEFIRELKKKFLIIGIEQRLSTYVDIADKQFEFKKVFTTTVVKELKLR